MNRKSLHPLRIFLFCAMLAVSMAGFGLGARADGAGSIVITQIYGTINPAADDYLKSALRMAEEQHAKLFILKLNTPGGLIPSMESMVSALLSAKIPTVVYVSPQGGGAMSAGVFITMAGHFAVMAPGTTIGAAHPVMGGGGDIQGDMREKIENFAVSLSKAIAEQRGRNIKWAELAVRESVAITDREAVAEHVVDFSASDMESLLAQLENKTVNVGGSPVTLTGLASSPRELVEMNFRQQVINFLSDPNVAMLLGIGALLGLGIELTHPGVMLPGIVGVICLVLSLIAGQVLPINQGGLLLLLLSAVCFVAEMFAPSFGALGVGGIVCLVLGSIYFIDSDQIWASGGFGINKLFIGSVAAVSGTLLFFVSMLALRTMKTPVTTGREGLVDQEALVVADFAFPPGEDRTAQGKVKVRGEIWQATLKTSAAELPKTGDRVVVEKLLDGLKLLVRERNKN